MRHTVAGSIVLAALAASTAWGQLSVVCNPSTLPEAVQTIVAVHCTASGGIAPYTWSISSGALPPNLSQDPGTGDITGTLADPAGPYSFTVTAKDSTPILHLSGSQPFSGTTVDPLTVSCVPANGPQEVNVPYLTSCTAGGGTPPYSWSLTSQNQTIPPGMTIPPTGTTVQINYTPTATQAGYQYSAKVVDSSPTPLTKGQTFAGSIAAPVTITTTSPLPPAAVGSSYSLTFAAAGGVGPYSWALSGQPGWLTINQTTGVLSGKPPSTTPATFAVAVTDSVGGVSSGPFTLLVTPALTISPSKLPPATVSVQYTQPLTASGGSGTGYTWAISGQPGWLTLNPGTGILSGNPPLSAVTSSFTIQLTDSNNNSISVPYTLAVTLQITTASTLPAASPGVPYNQTLTAVGGTGVYTWVVTSGAPPAGIALSTAGVLSGTLQANATSGNFTATVTDSSTATTSQPFTLPVALAITTAPTLPAATPGGSYSQTFAAVGGAGGYTWSATGLPSWLKLSATGALTGTVPSNATTSTFTVKVTDTANASASGTFTVPVGLTISPATLPPAIINTLYTQTLTASGGAGGYTWSASGLPTWLTLTAAGVLSGTPTAVGPVTFMVTVTDSSSAMQSISYTLQVNLPPLVITTTSPLANGAVGVVYNQTLSGTGGTGQGYTWSVTTGTLPPPLTLSPTGTISGSPSTAGTYLFTVQLADNATPTPDTTTKQFSITIGAGLTITTSNPLPNATVSVPYSQTLAAAGGSPPYTWSGTLPAPFTLSPSGVITGTPTTAGTLSPFTVTVTDAANTTANQQFTLTVVAFPSITTTTLPNASTGASYTQTLSATGGTTPYKWVVSSGTLPLGLSLSTAGTISGTPTVAGTSNFTVQLTDATGVTVTKALSITVISSLTITTPSPLPQGEATVPYSQTFIVSGGTAPFTWSLVSGLTPQGITLNPSGTLAGTTNTPGSYNFTVKVTDKNQASATATYNLTIDSTITITTPSTLNSGSVGTSYSQNLTASGGVAPYTWTFVSGSLPTGLVLSTGGGISGIPATAGTFDFTVKVTDVAGGSATAQFTIVVGTGLTVSSPATLPGATVNVSYSTTLTATGGTPPYTWTTTSGTPPPGLTLQSNGTLSGIPAATGTTTFTVQVTDSASHRASEAVTIVVATVPAITTTALPNGATGVAYSQTLSVSGGTAPFTWIVTTGNLPGGLSLSPAGSITGVPNAAGTFTFTVQAADKNGALATKQLSITISAGLTITTSASLPGATLNVPYTQALSASGGTTPYTWALTAGALPANVSLSPAGTISGTPSAAGTFNFTATVTDAANATASLQFTLVVAAVTQVTFTTTSLPAGTVGQSYSQTLAVTGGTPPYTFAVTSGSPPPGLSLVGSKLSGVPTTAGTYLFTIQATDSASLTASQAFTITISGLAITTSGTLPAAALGTSYSTTLAASGTAPFTWIVTQGTTLPVGLSLDPATGIISGIPTAAGTSTFTVQVTDSTNAVGTAQFSLTVIAATYSGLSATEAPAQQVSGTLALGAAYPQDINGTLTLTFTPDPSLASPVDDPAIQFSGGGRTTNFTIPANSTAPVSFALQTGTVAGTITLSVTWQAGGAALPSPAALTQTVQIAKAVAVISSVTATTTSSGFQVQITGYSNTRELSQANLQFTAAAGQSLQTTSLNVSLTAAATSWFQSSSSDAFGSQFILTLPFTVTSGTTSAIGSVSVQLVNSQGTSTSASATL